MVSFDAKTKQILLIVGLVVLIVAVFYFKAGTDLWASQTEILVLGSPSDATRAMLSDIQAEGALDISYVIKESFDDLKRSPDRSIEKYDIIMIDQTASPSKSLPIQLGSAIEKKVKAGGKLIVVRNSGTTTEYQTTTFEYLFGNIIPVSCGATDIMFPCSLPLVIHGRIYKQDYQNPWLEGIEAIPSMEKPETTFTCYNLQVKSGAKVIAYLEDRNHPQVGVPPALVENTVGLNGKVLWINFDPSQARAVFIKILESYG